PQGDEAARLSCAAAAGPVIGDGDIRTAGVTLQFLRFAIVGIAGLAVDAGVLYALMYGAGLGPLLARLPSFLCASAFTWIANRSWTYRGPHPGSMAGQWVRFVTVNAVGGVLNY